MKKIFTLILFSALMVMGTGELIAQKFGYMNSTALLAEMPDVKQAQANLEALKTQLQKKGQQELEKLQKDFQDVQRKYEQGLLSPKQQEEEAARLKTKEQELAQTEQQMIQQMAQKEQDLMKPILERVNTAIQTIAEDEGFTYIFDTSTGVLLFAEESLDVTDKVRQKLGM
jgi:outer membrane protein